MSSVFNLCCFVIFPVCAQVTFTVQFASDVSYQIINAIGSLWGATSVAHSLTREKNAPINPAQQKGIFLFIFYIFYDRSPKAQFILLANANAMRD